MHDTALLYGRHSKGSAGHRRECRELPVRLHRAREAFTALFRETFQRHNLTDPQWRVLRILSTVDELDTAALARRSMLLGPSLSRILRDLDDRKLVVRRSSAIDGRRILHALTPAARALIDKVVPEFDPFYQALCERVSEEDLNALNRALDKVAAAVREISGDRDD